MTPLPAGANRFCRFCRAGIFAGLISFLISTPAYADTGLQGEARALLDAVNWSRALAGLSPVRCDARMVRAARDHAKDMVRRDFFDHDSPDGQSIADRATRAGYAWQAVGENLSAGRETAGEVVQAWLDSPGHRDNMLDPDMRDAGVAYVRADPDPGEVRYGKYWVLTLGRSKEDAPPTLAGC